MSILDLRKKFSTAVGVGLAVVAFSMLPACSSTDEESAPPPQDTGSTSGGGGDPTGLCYCEGGRLSSPDCIEYCEDTIAK